MVKQVWWQGRWWTPRELKAYVKARRMIRAFGEVATYEE